MKNLKLAFLALAALCLIGNFQAFAHGNKGNIVVEVGACGGGSTNNETLFTSTSAPDNNIEHITVTNYNGDRFSFTGCGENACANNISNLEKGNYTANVSTSQCSFEFSFTKI